MAKSIRNLKKDERGFTLVELMAVVVILGILAAFAVPKVMGSVNNAKEKTDKANIQTLQRAVERVYMETNDYPDTLQELEGTYIEIVPKVPTDDDLIYSLDENHKVIKRAKASGE